MSFSAHADAVGILQLIDFCRPKNAVILVHGDSKVMDSMQTHIKDQFDIDCICPSNGEMITINTKSSAVCIRVPSKLLTHSVKSGCKKLTGTISLSPNSNNLYLSESTSAKSQPFLLSTKLLLSSEFINLAIYKKGSQLHQHKLAEEFISMINTFIFTKYSENGLFPQILSPNKLTYESIEITVTPLEESEFVVVERLDKSAKFVKDICVDVVWSFVDNQVSNELIDYMNAIMPNNFVN